MLNIPIVVKIIFSSALVFIFMGSCASHACPTGEERLSSCHLLKVISDNDASIFIGPEDITIDHEQNIAYISADPRAQVKLAQKAMKPSLPQGAIFALKLDDLMPLTQPVIAHDLTSEIMADRDFHPHGIFLQIDKNSGHRTLFVVNHAYALKDGAYHTGNFIERFTIDQPNRLIPDGQYNLDQYECPNDVAAIDHDQIFVTNSTERCISLTGFLIDRLLGRETGKVLYFKSPGASPEVIMENFGYANGINVRSVDQQSWDLYVADSISGEIRRKRFQSKEASEFIIRTLPGVDNLEWDEYGNLYAARCPSKTRFALYGMNRMGGGKWLFFQTAPSRASRIEFNRTEAREIPLFCDDGRLLSASSVAAAHRELMLIGSVFEHKLIICTNLAGKAGNEPLSVTHEK